MLVSTTASVGAAQAPAPPLTQPGNRVLQVRQFGGLEGLEVSKPPGPTAGPGEVRVHVLVASVNYTDVLIRRRLYPQTMRLWPPFTLGYDCRLSDRRIEAGGLQGKLVLCPGG